MRAHVTNRSGAARGFQSLDRGTVMVEPGASAELDLADHDLHRVWHKAGAVKIVPVSDVEPVPAPAPVAEKPKPKRR